MSRPPAPSAAAERSAGATTPTGTREPPPERPPHASAPASSGPVPGPGPAPCSTTRRAATVLRRSWPVLRWVAGVGLLVLAVEALSGHRGELSGLGQVLGHLRWWWLLPAAAAEAASLVAFVGMQQTLLRAGGLDPPLGPLTGITVGSQAMTNTLPAGSALAAVYGFRWYRRFGADDGLAGWALVGSSVAAALSLALVATLGLGIATEDGATLDLVPVVLGILAATLAFGALFLYERPLAAVARWGLRTSGRLIGRPRGDHERAIQHLVERATVVRLDARQVLKTVGWGGANWLLDCACFALAFLATGSGIPWEGLLLAYGAGQLAANLPITPGGLGAVEGSITIALSYFGGATTADVGAVFVYRLFSFWLVLLVGWLWAGGLALAVRRGLWARNAREAPVATGVGGVRMMAAWTGDDGSGDHPGRRDPVTADSVTGDPVSGDPGTGGRS
ncbi:MAG: lysylphosphatidylglycerol synthase transmembrane domain-containing protein [Acidimicrobiales bacterium]